MADTPNFAEMSDEDIMNMDPTSFGGGEETEEAPDESQAAPESSEEASEVTPDETDGAVEASADEDESQDSDDVEEGDRDDTSSEASEETSEAPDPYQGSDTAKEAEAGETTESDEIDYKASFEQLMAPFKAARREVHLENVDDARRLMQMGVDYSRKMEQMKPHLRVLRTLDKAGLTDPDKVNYLIDLHEKNPEAIKKLLKDSSIDPMDLELEGSESYKPTDHAVSDSEMGLQDAFESIQELPSYSQTLEVIQGLDNVSKQQLQDNPAVIAKLGHHVEAKVYDKIWAKVETERMFGRLAGLSDLDAYYEVGEALYKAGLLGPTPDEASSAPSQTTQATAQGNGSPTSSKAKPKANKRAASPTRGNAAKGGPRVPDLSTMSDEEIMNLDLSSLR